MTPAVATQRLLDPRSRYVVAARSEGYGDMTLILECGHCEHRKFRVVPSSIICTQCPRDGGLGGRGFWQP